jgi:hypothetical protein
MTIWNMCKGVWEVDFRHRFVCPLVSTKLSVRYKLGQAFCCIIVKVLFQISSHVPMWLYSLLRGISSVFCKSMIGAVYYWITSCHPCCSRPWLWSWIWNPGRTLGRPYSRGGLWTIFCVLFCLCSGSLRAHVGLTVSSVVNRLKRIVLRQRVQVTHNAVCLLRFLHRHG